MTHFLFASRVFALRSAHGSIPSSWLASMLLPIPANNSMTFMTLLSAVRHQACLSKSPDKNIPNGKMVNREYDRFITMEEYALLLDACPTQEWRVIVALARIGGLRFQKQQCLGTTMVAMGRRSLDGKPIFGSGFENGMILATSWTYCSIVSRIASRIGKALCVGQNEDEWICDRTLPADKLEFVLSVSDDSTPCWFGRYHSPVRQHANEPENEIVCKFGSKKESLWMGHSDKVMLKHYFVLGDEDFAEAAGADLESKKPMQNPMQNRLLRTGKWSKIGIGQPKRQVVWYRVFRHVTAF